MFRIFYLCYQMTQSRKFTLLFIFFGKMSGQKRQDTTCSFYEDHVCDHRADAAYIGDFHAAPHFMKENDKIHKGYRINFNSIRQLSKSLFMIHNESVNIWSHLIPLLVFLGVMVSFWMIIDDHEFKKTVSDYRQDIENTYVEYQSMMKNLTMPENLDKYGEQVKNQMKQLKNKVFVKYNEIIAKIAKKTNHLNALLDLNVQGLKESFKQELRIKLREVEKYLRNYEETIAPEFVQKVQKELHSDILDQIRAQTESLKDHLDSGIFRPMQLHPESPNLMYVSRWPLFIFLLTAVLCMLFSTIFHWFYPLSLKTYGLLLRFDFAGISLLIAGSSFPPFYYGMYCTFAVAEIYLILIICAATICFILGLFEFIHKHENAIYRSIIFGTFGLSLSIPLFHLVINEFVFDNYGDPFQFSSSYPYYIFGISSYILGLYIFTVKCPQRNNPGKYDICGHSHQIWHFLVVLGVLGTYLGALQNFEMRKRSICPA